MPTENIKSARVRKHDGLGNDLENKTIAQIRKEAYEDGYADGIEDAMRAEEDVE